MPLFLDESDTARERALIAWYLHARPDAALRIARGATTAAGGAEGHGCFPIDDFASFRAVLPERSFALRREDVSFLRGVDLPGPFPPCLLAKGNAAALARPTVGIVGTRKPTIYGRRMALAFASELAAAGVTVVSGGALGVDFVANRSALGNGFSVAVIGGGLARPHPASHAGFFDALAASGRGLVLSQFPSNEPARPWHFPRRNATLAALCDFVLVVEASLRSGSLITAREALDRGIDVGAVPGALDSPLSSGTNALIADGAFCVREPRDVLERLAGLGRLRARYARLFEAPPRAGSEAGNASGACTEDARVEL